MSGLAIQDERLGRRVGAILLVALIAAGTLVVTLYGRIQWHRTITFEVAFEHIGTLHEGAPVMQAGQRLGVVRAIRLAPPDATSAPGVRAVVQMERRFVPRVAQNAVFFIGTKGLFGEKYLEVGPPPDSARAPVTDGVVLRGVDPPMMDRVLIRTWQNLSISKRFLEEVGPEFRALTASLDELAAEFAALAPAGGDLAEAASSLRGVANAASAFQATLLDAGVDATSLSSLRTRANELRTAAERAVSSLAESAAQLEGSLRLAVDRIPPDLRKRVTAIADQLKDLRLRLPALAAQADGIAARIRNGQGTVGSLLHDPEFSDDAKQLGRTLKRNPWRVFGHDQE